MKILGHSNKTPGNIIVELSSAEAHTLTLLESALSGDTYDWSHRIGIDLPKEREFDKAFQAVYRFTQANFAINELGRTIATLDDIVNGSKQQDLLKDNEYTGGTSNRDMPSEG